MSQYKLLKTHMVIHTLTVYRSMLRQFHYTGEELKIVKAAIRDLKKELINRRNVLTKIINDESIGKKS